MKGRASNGDHGRIDATDPEESSDRRGAWQWIAKFPTHTPLTYPPNSIFWCWVEEAGLMQFKL
jgi:hypothetical protein